MPVGRIEAIAQDLIQTQVGNRWARRFSVLFQQSVEVFVELAALRAAFDRSFAPEFSRAAIRQARLHWTQRAKVGRDA